MRQRTFKATEDTKRRVARELQIYLEALCHDAQFSIRRACELLELLALPKRLTREQQFVELEKRLALQREAAQWGRPWTVYQIRRCFYAGQRDFKRAPPAKPVTKAELASYEPVMPPAARTAKTRGGASG